VTVLRYLVALIWPLGLALLAGAAYLLITRTPAQAQTTPAEPGPQHSQNRPSQNRPSQHRPSHKAPGIASGLDDGAWESARFGAVALAGTLVVFGLMCALGLIVVHQGLAVDRPIFDWMSKHQVHVLAALMKRLTKLGDTWTTWGAALAAAACLAVTWRQRKWLPPVVLTTVIVADHFTTLALRHVFHRLGPPTSPLGTYPSGGCDRVILFYGLIGYLLWSEFSGQRRTAIAIAAAVAGLGFSEAYSRVYLSLHWFTDAVSGLLYGGLLLVIFIIAVHFVVGAPGPLKVQVRGQRHAVPAGRVSAAGTR
jgi:membrane-associated phospholipid phosphatase